MSIHTKDQLLAEIQPTHAIPLTIGLDQGYLLITGDTIQFIAQRFGGWDVVENYKRVNFVKIHTESNFMGRTVTLNFQNGRLHCKNIPDGVDLQALLTGVASQNIEPVQDSQSVSSISKDSTQEEPHLLDLLDKFLESDTVKSKSSTNQSTTEESQKPKKNKNSKSTPKNTKEQQKSTNKTDTTDKPIEPATSTPKKIEDLVVLNTPEQAEDKPGCGCVTVFKYLFWLFVLLSFLESFFE